jgi:hypothetical protein
MMMIIIDEILYYVWDPFGVKETPGMRDEYTSDADFVWRMVLEGKDENGIADYLNKTSFEYEVLSDEKHNSDVAKLVISWRNYYLNF